VVRNQFLIVSLLSWLPKPSFLLISSFLVNLFVILAFSPAAAGPPSYLPSFLVPHFKGESPPGRVPCYFHISGPALDIYVLYTPYPLCLSERRWFPILVWSELDNLARKEVPRNPSTYRTPLLRGHTRGILCEVNSNRIDELNRFAILQGVLQRSLIPGPSLAPVRRERVGGSDLSDRPGRIPGRPRPGPTCPALSRSTLRACGTPKSRAPVGNANTANPDGARVHDAGPRMVESRAHSSLSAAPYVLTFCIRSKLYLVRGRNPHALFRFGVITRRLQFEEAAPSSAPVRRWLRLRNAYP
jgi:hypothetical protein